jgi:hypothetical protein
MVAAHFSPITRKPSDGCRIPPKSNQYNEAAK